jgi:hypothetical protein
MAKAEAAEIEAKAASEKAKKDLMVIHEKTV